MNSKDDPIAKTFLNCANNLHHADTYSKVIEVCRDLNSISLDLFSEHARNETYNILHSAVVQYLCTYFGLSKDLSFQLKVLKAILKPALCLNYLYVENMLESQGLRSECLRTYTWLQNIDFITKFGVALPDNLRITETFHEASSQYSEESRYFAVAIENLIVSFDISDSPSYSYTTFKTLFTNLENLHQNVHKLLLELFKKLITHYDIVIRSEGKQKRPKKKDRRMIKDILGLPWTDRNKYQLLAIIISINHKILVNDSFDLESFMGGLQVGLSIHHLMAPSQSLVKAIKDNDVFKTKLIEIVARLLWEGDDQLVDNLIKYWFSALDLKIKQTVYNIMSADGKFENIPTTSAKFYRLLVLRNAFKRIFKQPELDARIMNFACEIESVEMKIEIFHILMDNVHAEADSEQRLRNIFAVLKFIRFNMCIEDSSFIDQHVMRKLPEFFNLLATMKMRNLQQLKEIFKIISINIYQHGIELGTYESLSFSVKFLNVILKQYIGVKESSLTKNTNIAGNLSFGEYLKDNQIWDVTSNEMRSQLIKQMEGEEHSDISEMAQQMIVDHFIAKICGSENYDPNDFTDWICIKANEMFSRKDISSASSTNRYFIIQLEKFIHMDSNLESITFSVKHVLEIISFLNNRYLFSRADPVKSMQEGTHLFRLLDCMNYGVKRCGWNVIGGGTKIFFPTYMTDTFLNFISDEEVPPSFEVFDEYLNHYITISSYQDSTNFVHLKQKLTLYIWFTLRSLSELSETIAKAAVVKNGEIDILAISISIQINIKILTRCCHKGLIDSASTALGNITKIVYNEYSKYCNPAKEFYELLIMLKREILCEKRPSSATGDIRSSRGLIVMALKIITNFPPFLRFLMEALLAIPKTKSDEDAKQVKFVDNVMPIQLHLLAGLIKDSNLAEDMLKYYNFILLATLKAYKKSSDFVVNNALLQIIGAIVPKISNQKRHLMLGEEVGEMLFEPKSVTAYEFVKKFPHVFKTGLVDLNDSQFPATYTIILLEIFSNFEHRNPIEACPEVEKIRSVFAELMNHRCEKIRIMAAKCSALWFDPKNLTLEIVTKDALKVFSEDANLVHSTTHCMRFTIQRYESNIKFVRSFNSADFMSSLRSEISKSFEEKGRKFKGAHDFFIRYHLLDFLMFLGFSFNDDIVQSLLIETGLKSHFGYKAFAQKVKELSANCVK